MEYPFKPIRSVLTHQPPAVDEVDVCKYCPAATYYADRKTERLFSRIIGLCAIAIILHSFIYIIKALS